MTNSKVDVAAAKAHFLDNETQDLMNSIRKKNTKAVVAFIVCWSVLLVVGLVGIFRQNQIAMQNKNHIDCIVKLLATPLPEGARARVLTNASTSCNIKFTI